MDRRAGFLAVLAGSFLVSASASAGDAASLRGQAIVPDQVLDSVKSPTGLVSVLVKLGADPAATYKGGIPGLGATSPQVTGSRLRRGQPAVQAYDRFLAPGKEQAFGAALSRAVPRARIVHRLRTIFGGVSVVLPRDQVKRLSTLPDVKAVYPDALLPLDMDRSPEFIGAPELWDRVGGSNRAGEGVIVGVRRQRHLAGASVLRRRGPSGASREVDGHGVRVRLRQPGRPGLRLQQQAHRRPALHGHLRHLRPRSPGR